MTEDHSPRILLDDSYATYPHSNGYYDGGARIALGMAAGADEIVGVRLDGSGEPEVLLSAEAIAAESDLPPWSESELARSVPWFDVALDAQTLVCARDDALFVVELAGDRTPRIAHRPADGWALDGLTSVSADGRTALVSEMRDGVHRALTVDVRTGATTEIVRHPWFANHFHLVPADESWIGYSHEGAATQVDDRLWAWNREDAPDGRRVVDQRTLSAQPPAAVALGHERWMFHDTGAVVVAYGESEAGPRGIYEVFVDGRAPRLVSAGERDWHCGITRDGRTIVVDTTGPADLPGRGWADAGTASSIQLIDAASGERRTIAETGFISHPYHPHPSFTPDGGAVVFNHVERDERGAVIRRGAAIVVRDREAAVETGGDLR